MPAPTEQWIKQQLRLCKKATKGPWVYQKHLGCKNIGPRRGIRKIYGLLYTAGLSDEAKDRANARLCAAAREGYPAVMEGLRVATRLLALVLTELDHMVMHNPECLCDKDCREEARAFLNQYHDEEAADASEA